MNLLERMAEALRATAYETQYHPDHPVVRRADAILAEYERDKERLVLLKFEKAERELRESGARYMVLDKDNGKQFLLGSVNPCLDYAFAPLPPLPGPEVFK